MDKKSGLHITKILVVMLLTAFGLCALALPARAAEALTLRLQMDGAAAPGYSVVIGGATALDSGSTGSYAAEGERGADAVRVLKDGSEVWSGTVDFTGAAEATLALYHCNGAVTTAPAVVWSGAGAAAGTDYVLSSADKTVAVKTALGLSWLAEHYNDADTGDTDPLVLDLTGYKYLLDADLNLSGKGWTPIQATAVHDFDGQGHALTGLFADSAAGAGLFGTVAAGSTVKNLAIAKGFFRGLAAGSVAGTNNGTVANCWSDSTVRAAAGGTARALAGTGTVLNSRFSGDAPTAADAAVSYSGTGGWTGAEDAQKAAELLEAGALAAAGYTHWKLDKASGMPVFLPESTFTAAVTLRLDGTAADLAAIAYRGLTDAASTLWLGGTKLTYSAGVYSAAMAPGNYTALTIRSGADASSAVIQTMTVAVTSARPTAEEDFYSVTLSGGTGISATSGGGTFLSGETTTLGATVQSGYSWQKWTYTSGGADYNTAQAPAVTVSARLALTANAALTAYPITYDLAGGAVTPADANPASYTGLDAVTLVNPTRTGYTFRGWTGTGLAAASLAVSFPAGSSGARAYTAAWVSADATLTNLAASAGALNEPFSPALRDYTVTAGCNTLNTSVVPTPAEGATVVARVNGAVVTDLSNLPLAIGGNTVQFTVTAADGVTQNVYTLTVNRSNYGFTADSGGTHVKGTTQTLTFRCTGDYSRFTGLRVDNVAVPTNRYALAGADGGNTLVTLSSAYLEGLANGNHVITFLYGDESASMVFTVSNTATSPQTGDGWPRAAAALLLVSGALAAGALALRRRRGRSA